MLRYLFVPPLTEPRIQPRTFSGIDRRDAVFPNRNMQPTNNWGRLYCELEARMILFEFKNYDKQDVGKYEINQTRSYLTRPMGRLAFVCSSEPPNKAARIKRNSIYNQDDIVILFLTVRHLEEMLSIKERREDPSELIMDLLEGFYLEHE